MDGLHVAVAAIVPSGWAKRPLGKMHLNLWLFRGVFPRLVPRSVVVWMNRHLFRFRGKLEKRKCNEALFLLSEKEKKTIHLVSVFLNKIHVLDSISWLHTTHTGRKFERRVAPPKNLDSWCRIVIEFGPANLPFHYIGVLRVPDFPAKLFLDFSRKVRSAPFLKNAHLSCGTQSGQPKGKDFLCANSICLVILDLARNRGYLFNSPIALAQTVCS